MEFEALYNVQVAVQNGDMQVIKKFLKEGGDPNIYVLDDDTLFDTAVRFNQNKIAFKFIKYGGKINHELLISAADGGNKQFLKYALKNNPYIDINFKDKDSYSIIDCAVSSGNIDTVQMLLDFGAKPTSDTLCCAAQSGSTLMVSFIINLLGLDKVDLNEALITAVQWKSYDTVVQLVELGADPNYTYVKTYLDSDPESKYTYTYNVLTDVVLHVYEEDVCYNLIIFLLQKGADPTKTGFMGMNLLEIAVQNDNTRTVEYLLNSDYKFLNSIYTDNTDLLQICVNFLNYNTTKLLLEKGFSPNSKKLVKHIVLFKNKEMYQLFVDNNLNNELKNYAVCCLIKSYTESIFVWEDDWYVKLNEYLSFILTTVDLDNTVLHTVLKVNIDVKKYTYYLEAVKMIVPLITDLNVKNKEGLIPIDIAVSTNKPVEIIKFLIQSGCTIDFTQCSHKLYFDLI